MIKAGQIKKVTQSGLKAKGNKGVLKVSDVGEIHVTKCTVNKCSCQAWNAVM